MSVEDARVVRQSLLPIEESPTDYEALLFRARGARVVLVGEATHGTHEFYRERARITRHLIEDEGFAAVAIEGDWRFHAEQSARLVRDAEAYYRSLFRADDGSWNLRERHLATTLFALTDFLDRHWERSRVVVWAHNTHVQDARATEMGPRGRLSLGQLCRERFGDEALLVGFTTYEGTVTAASRWEGEVERRWVRPALEGSVEHLFHQVGAERFLLELDPASPAFAVLDRTWLHRAIGVLYQPEHERPAHYVHVRPARAYDVLVHLEETRAVEPLEPTLRWVAGEAPATFPSTF